MTKATSRSRFARAWVPWLALVLLAIGAWLRLRGLSNMEFKRDEQEALNLGIRLLEEHPWSSASPWPTHGMPSSNNIGNAPLFTWLIAIAWAPFKHPVMVAWLIALTNVVCLYSLWRWARHRMSESSALLTLAIAAVSPFGVILSRKIWSQDLLCVGVLSMLWGIEWLRGTRPWRGLAMLVMAVLLLGQLHQSGPIALTVLAAAVALQWWTDRLHGTVSGGMGRASALEAAAMVCAVALTLFFWLPYLGYLWRLPPEIFRLRPTIPSVSLDLLQRVGDQVRPIDLFYFFRSDSDDFLADWFRRWCFQASVALGTPLLLYGGWRWIRAPYALPVLGFWWLVIIVVFAVARIPTYPFYVLVLMPLPVVIAAGAFDGPLSEPHALGLLLCRVAYTASLLGLTIGMQSWLFERGGSAGDYGVNFAIREAQARTIIGHYRSETPAPLVSLGQARLGEMPALECRPVPIEVTWIVRWLDSTAATALESQPIRLCDGWVANAAPPAYRWFLGTD